MKQMLHLNGAFFIFPNSVEFQNNLAPSGDIGCTIRLVLI